MTVCTIDENTHDGSKCPSNAGDIFQGLRDFKNLTRERSLASLKSSVNGGVLTPEDLEPLALDALCAESWEAKQGGLLAAAFLIETWDRPDFRKNVLQEVPTLLQDKEYRVRKAVAAVLCECCRRDGLRVYDSMSSVVLGDIKSRFQRTIEADEDPTAPPTFLPDTEGWRSLETSMGALEAMMQGCGIEFTSRITNDMLELLTQCSKHTNRFVREYAFFAFKDTFAVCSADEFLRTVGPQTVGVIAAGIADNWSQVRYAASVAAREFMDKAGDQKERFYPVLLGAMCLNRHYVAEGVRLYSQETWRIVCGPQGGARLLVAYFDSVIDVYSQAATASNHAVREAACHCITELVTRVAGSPEKPSSYREHFTQSRVQQFLQTLQSAFQDESWPVRDVASTALGNFVRCFPLDCEAYRPQFLELWFDQISDNIPSLRQNGAAALAMGVAVWSSQWWDLVLSRIQQELPQVLMQSEKSETFTDYMPSGPFSVPRSKPMSQSDQSNPAFTDQTMYSCGSAAPKTFKRRSSAAGCMNCVARQPHQLWEVSEGMVHLVAELALSIARGGWMQSQLRLDVLASLLPDVAKAFQCSHFRHHHLLKQRICERLPSMTSALGPERMHPHVPKFLKTLHECAKQDVHLALRECAQEVLAAWRLNTGLADVVAEQLVA